MNIIGKLLRVVKHDDIYEYLNRNIDEDFSYTNDWERECQHVVSFLNRLIVRKYDGVSERQQTRVRNSYRSARAALTVPECESDIADWIRQLDAEFFPVLAKVW